MSKAIEDKLTVLIKETFMRIETGNFCVQTKIGTRTIKKTYPSLYPPALHFSTPVTVFFIAGKLQLSLWL